jgi:hypothetical protein
VEDIPEQGRRFSISANDTTRAAIAASAGLRSLERLDATFDVTRRSQNGLHVSGEVRATIGQSCVVTLEPVDSTVVESVDVDFVPDPLQRPTGVANETAPLDDTAEDPPEPLVNGTVDLGALAVEFLILGIDPYPRKPGATFVAPSVEAGDAGPFAALAKLKRRPEKGK